MGFRLKRSAALAVAAIVPALMLAVDLPLRIAAGVESMPTVAFMCTDSCSALPNVVFAADQAFVRGLEGHGYRIGRDVKLDMKSTGLGTGHARLTEAARQLVERKVNVIVVMSNRVARVVRAATSDIPIVMMGVADPVEEGLVETLSKPGGNLTGVALPSADLITKQIELLREIRPGATRIGVFFDPTAYQRDRLKRVESAVRHLGVRIEPIELSSQANVTDAFSSLRRAQGHGVVVLEHLALSLGQREIVLAALRDRVPTVSSRASFTQGGGLMAYGPDFVDVFESGAGYVGKILKGSKPRDLPVSEPTRFEITVNRVTAKAIGVTVPPSLEIRASQIFE